MMLPTARAVLATWQQWSCPSSFCCCWGCAVAWWCSTCDTVGCRTTSLPLPTLITIPAWARPSSPPGTSWVRGCYIEHIHQFRHFDFTISPLWRRLCEFGRFAFARRSVKYKHFQYSGEKVHSTFIFKCHDFKNFFFPFPSKVMTMKTPP